jgi:hypothetical protein
MAAASRFPPHNSREPDGTGAARQAGHSHRRCNSNRHLPQLSSVQGTDRPQRHSHRDHGCTSQRRCIPRHDKRLSPAGAAVQRKADRVVAEFRRTGRDRDGERAANQRDARSLGAADRDRGGVAGYKFLARRPRACVRRNARKSVALVRCCIRCSPNVGWRVLTRVAWRAPHGFEDVSPKAVPAAPGSLAERFVRGENVISISDLVDDANFQRSVGAQSLVHRGNARTFLGLRSARMTGCLGRS